MSQRGDVLFVVCSYAMSGRVDLWVARATLRTRSVRGVRAAIIVFARIILARPTSAVAPVLAGTLKSHAQ